MFYELIMKRNLQTENNTISHEAQNNFADSTRYSLLKI